MSETLDIEPLTGPGNYTRWERKFKVLAVTRNLLDLYKGTERLLLKPDRPPPVNPRADAFKIKPGMKEEEIAGVQAAFREANNEYQIAIQTYKLDLDEYDKQQTRKREACVLLAKNIDPDLLSAVTIKDNPKEAADNVAALCKLQESRAVDQALDNLEKLTLNQCSSMSDYINKAIAFRQDFRDAVGSGTRYGDDEFKSKLLRGLPFSYSGFVDHYHMIQEDPNITRTSLKALQSQLLAYETKVNERRRQQQSFMKRPKPRTPTRNRCPGCGYTNHKADDCYKLHPEKRPKNKASGSEFGQAKPKRMVAAAIADEAFEQMLSCARTKHEQRNAKNEQKPKGTSHTLPCPTPSTDVLTQGKLLRGTESKGELGFRGSDDDALSSRDVFRLPTVSLSSLLNQAALSHQNQTTSVAFSCAPQVSLSPNIWILDSGANLYVCNNAAWFTELHKFRTSMATAENSTPLQILGGGTVRLTTIDGDGEPFELELRDVAYAPGSSCNLLSISKLANAGLSGIWDHDKMHLVTREGFRIGTVKMTNGLYYLAIDNLPIDQKQAQLPFAGNVDFDDPVWKWHRRLGHLSFDRMLKLFKVSNGITLTEKQIKAKQGAICPVCATTRGIVNIPREPARRHFRRPGNLLHVDLWGPYSIDGWDKTLYFLFITDDATRYTWAARIESRKDMPNVLRDNHKQIERTHNIVIRRYRGDNEFNQGPWKRWSDKHGIKNESTAPYAHHQVGVSERANRTIREGAAALTQETALSGQLSTIITERGEELLRNSNLPQALWPEAVQHAVWLKNRAPTRALKNRKTPWECLYGDQPDLSEEKIWGSRAYVPYTEEERRRRRATRKLHDDRAWLGYYMGRTSEGQFRIWNPQRSTVVCVDTARFDDGTGLDDDHQQVDELQSEEPNVSSQAREIASDDNYESADELLSEDDPDIDHGTRLQPPDDEATSEDNVNHDEESEDESSDSDGDENEPVVSRYFTAMVKRKKAESDDTDSVTDDDSDEGNQLKQQGQKKKIKVHSDLLGPGPLSDYLGPANDQPTTAQSSRGKADRVTCEKCGKETTRKNMYRHMKAHQESVTKFTCSHCGKSLSNKSNLERHEATHQEQRSKDYKCDECEKTFYDKDGLKTHKKAHEEPKYHCPRCSKSFVHKRSFDDHVQHVDCHKQQVSHQLSNLDTSSSDENDDITEKYSRQVKNPDKHRGQVRPEQRCHYCYHTGYKCTWTDGNEKCDRCIRHKQICRPVQLDPDGSLPLSKSTGKVPTTWKRREDKCAACATRRKICDGQYPYSTPCSECVSHDRHCRPQDAPEKPKCKWCKTLQYACNRKQPCSTCIEHKQACTYGDAERSITCTPSLNPNQNKYNPEDMRCTACRSFGRDCNAVPGGPPCIFCMAGSVKLEGQVSCIIWTAPGVREKIKKSAFEIITSEDGEQTVQRKQPTIDGSDRDPNHSTDAGDDESEVEDERTRVRRKLANVKLPEHFLTYHPSPDLNLFHEMPLALSTYRETVDLARAPLPQTFREAINGPESASWKEAIQNEYDSLIQNNTWEVTDLPSGRKPLTTKWVLKRKLGPDGNITKYKARMVARGFQQTDGLDYTETFSGVVKPATYRLLFATLLWAGWICHQMDVQTAFLNGDLEEEVYINPPEGFPEDGKVLHLIKALYGLKQAPRAWYKKLKEWLIRNNWERSKYDECVFFHRGLCLIIAVYVDDLLIFGNKERDIQTFKDSIATTFRMTDLGRISYYLGMEFVLLSHGLLIHQKGFINQILNRYNMGNIKSVATPLDANDKLLEETSQQAAPAFKQEYMSKVGSLNYVQTKTRPDISYAVSLVSRYMKNPNQQHMDAVNRIYAYLAGTKDVGLFYTEETNAHDEDNLYPLQGFVDSDWGGCKDTGRSTTGWIYMFEGNPISWSSHRQKSVSTSSAEAEYVAASDAAKEAIWLQGLLDELYSMIGSQPQSTIPLHIDNVSAIKITKNPEFHGRTKHINIRHHFIRECVEQDQIRPLWISGKENVADILTKALHKPTFDTLFQKLGLRTEETTFAAIAQASKQDFEARLEAAKILRSICTKTCQQCIINEIKGNCDGRLPCNQCIQQRRQCTRSSETDLESLFRSMNLQDTRNPTARASQGENGSFISSHLSLEGEC